MCCALEVNMPTGLSAAPVVAVFVRTGQNVTALLFALSEGDREVSLE